MKKHPSSTLTVRLLCAVTSAVLAFSACSDEHDASKTTPMTFSMPDAYWLEATAQIRPSSPSVSPDLTVDESSVYQEFDGFGGAFNEQGWDALMALDETARRRALQLLFDARDGARFRFGRVPIGASDYALDRYTLDDAPGDYAMQHFTIERDRRLLIPYVQAALAFQPALRLWASAWTPPPWMKTNNAYDSGAMRSDAPALDAYALYLARFVEAYGDEGLNIEALHVQNEPAEQTEYPSCSWSPELIRDFVRDHLGPLFESRRVPAGIWLGTLNTTDMRYPTIVLSDEGARRYIRGIGMQYGGLWIMPQLVDSYPGLPIMQTEVNAGNHRSEANYDPDRAPNDHAYGMFVWNHILSYLRAGVRSHMAWNMVLDTEGRNIGSQWRWPQNALLVVDRQTRRLRETPAYWAFRHFSAFIEPGARRIGLSGNHDKAIAFRNPDGRLVVMLENPYAYPKTLALSARGSVLDVDLTPYSWATIALAP